MMKIVDRKIDNAVQSYWKNWLNSLERPHASVILSNIVLTFSILFWSASLTTQFGFDLKKGPGILVFIAIWLFISLGILLVTLLMAKLGVERRIRSALLLAAIIGPYINLIAYLAWDRPTVSHILGFVSSIIAFLFSLVLDKILSRNPS